MAEGPDLGFKEEGAKRRGTNGTTGEWPSRGCDCDAQRERRRGMGGDGPSNA